MLLKQSQSLPHQHIVIEDVARGGTEFVDTGFFCEFNPDLWYKDPFEVKASYFQCIAPSYCLAKKRQFSRTSQYYNQVQSLNGCPIQLMFYYIWSTPKTRRTTYWVAVSFIQSNLLKLLYFSHVEYWYILLCSKIATLPEQTNNRKYRLFLTEL